MNDSINDIYGVAIALLLPLTATILVVQKNPYYALVLRGIVGAVAALVYALFGAADVALTEALVGTMLSITLYAIAVRSSLSMRLGILESPEPSQSESLDRLTDALRQPLQHQHLRLELVPYPSLTALNTALEQKNVHTIAINQNSVMSVEKESGLKETTDQENHKNDPLYELRTRVPRLHSILSNLSEEVATSVYVSLPNTLEPPLPGSTQSIFEQSDLEKIKGA
ncbi:MAG: DUF4040 domain-containing protein [Leptolyngbyaceae bacterium]|nr:DUF4040 domain-containing protein [Leptolyngbyaceae bacterium]